jgi:hypothetical protein
MKKFIVKSALFIGPFLVSFILFTQYGSVSKGDLIRSGCLIDYTSDYHKKFDADYSQNLYFKKLSQAEKNEKFDILTIGDSFSQQGNIGYQNYLAKNEGFNIVHYDGINSNDNPLETLYGIINGDILDRIKVDYIVLQSVERTFSKSGNRINKLKTVNYHDYQEAQLFETVEPQSPNLFSKSTVAFPLYNLLYSVNDKAYFSPVYKTALKKELFSTGNNDLLFYYNEVKNLSINNNKQKVITLNEELNTLAAILKKKAIKLIVLPCPDKYGIYFNYIKKNDKYPKPLFFEHLTPLQKEYIYINSKGILSDAQNEFKDLYFYDDTHWSPVASKLIAKEINSQIKQHSN